MKYTLVIFGAILIAILIAHKAMATEGRELGPRLNTGTQDSKVCAGIFDKHGELVDIECNLPKVETNGKSVPQKKGL